MHKKQGGSAEDRFALLDEFLGCKTALGRFISRIVGVHDIDDILQETFIRACAASEKSAIRHPRSFMFKTAQNLALNHVTSAYYKRTDIEDFSSSEVPGPMESLESDFDSREKFLKFCRAVRALPLQCRRVFVLRKVYGLSQQEIAEYLEISESTVEKHVTKGLLLCRASMGGDLDNKAGKERAPAYGNKRSGHA